jgi:hypothetical protein
MLQQSCALSPGVLSAASAIAGALGAILAAVITAILAKTFLGARDRQDREVEWRKHALELTKLDLERKLKTRPPGTAIRPSILDFLANYRDLQELGKTTPKELYETILKSRITKSDRANTSSTDAPLEAKGSAPNAEVSFAISASLAEVLGAILVLAASLTSPRD